MYFAFHVGISLLKCKFLFLSIIFVCLYSVNYYYYYCYEWSYSLSILFQFNLHGGVTVRETLKILTGPALKDTKKLLFS